MADKIIYGLYGDDDHVLEATKEIVASGYSVNEVYSPYPVHGLDTAMGLKYSRLSNYFVFIWFNRFCSYYSFNVVYYDFRLAHDNWW